MKRVTSRDGTPVAFDRSGGGNRLFCSAANRQIALRNRLKRGSEVVARYPTEHHEKSIPDRPLR